MAKVKSKPKTTRGPLSAAGRANISRAQIKRWKEYRKQRDARKGAKARRKAA